MTVQGESEVSSASICVLGTEKPLGLEFLSKLFPWALAVLSKERLQVPVPFAEVAVYFSREE